MSENTYPKITINSSRVKYTDYYIESEYDYMTSKVTMDDVSSDIMITPECMKLLIRTEKILGKCGVMLVGWGGNNGTTFTAAILSNKHRLEWNTTTGKRTANWLGSITQASTVWLGTRDCKDVHAPMNTLLPMLNPNDIEIDGWDISDLNLADAMCRAQVLDIDLQHQLKPYMALLKPRKGIYVPDFIAANQDKRANNVIYGTKLEQLNIIRKDIAEFKRVKNLDKVIILWTANTERFSHVTSGINDTADNLLNSIDNNYSEISPSTIFAVAAILEGSTYLNGSPQNTFLPGVIELAERSNVFIGGDDFKSGQTKLKSVLVDFLISAGIKPLSIVSYNHLGNNDGLNLSAPNQFKSKEVSKSSVVDDMVESNKILYPSENDKPNHCIVIKYVPAVGDSKRAMDEYYSEIMLGGHNTIVVNNICEDSLLATPIMLDMIILSELCSRIKIKKKDNPDNEYESFNNILFILSYLFKAPIIPKHAPLVNALFRQRSMIDNVLRACLGLPPIDHMHFEYMIDH